jgi:hypothetical protein
LHFGPWTSEIRRGRSRREDPICFAYSCLSFLCALMRQFRRCQRSGINTLTSGGARSATTGSSQLRCLFRVEWTCVCRYVNFKARAKHKAHTQCGRKHTHSEATRRSTSFDVVVVVVLNTGSFVGKCIFSSCDEKLMCLLPPFYRRIISEHNTRGCDCQSLIPCTAWAAATVCSVCCDLKMVRGNWSAERVVVVVVKMRSAYVLRIR